MKSKDKQYEKLIWSAFGQEEHFDKIRYRLIRIRDIMSKSQKIYSSMSSTNQFSFACTILIIVTQSTTKNLRQISLSKDKTEVFEYSIDEGFTALLPVDISIGKLSLRK